MTMGGWLFFILAGGAITTIMIFSYIKVMKSDSADNDIDKLYDQ